MSFKKMRGNKPKNMDMVTYAWVVIDDPEEEQACMELLDDHVISYGQAAREIHRLSGGQVVNAQAVRHWHLKNTQNAR